MIVAGFGFRASARCQSLQEVFERVAGGHRVEALAAPDDKAGGDALGAFAQALGLPIYKVSANELQVQRTWTQSDASQKARGTGSVAEAAALAAAGKGARLITARQVSSDGQATCALAEGSGA